MQSCPFFVFCDMTVVAGVRWWLVVALTCSSLMSSDTEYSLDACWLFVGGLFEKYLFRSPVPLRSYKHMAFLILVCLAISPLLNVEFAIILVNSLSYCDGFTALPTWQELESPEKGVSMRYYVYFINVVVWRRMVTKDSYI